MKITVKNTASTTLPLIIVPVEKGENSERILPKIADLTRVPLEVIKQDFEGKAKETHSLFFSDNDVQKRILLLGLGEKPKFQDVLNIFRSYVFHKKAQLPKKISVSFNYQQSPENTMNWLEAATNGILLARYEIGQYKTDKKAAKDFLGDQAGIEFVVDKSMEKSAKKAVQKGQLIAESQLEILHLVAHSLHDFLVGDDSQRTEHASERDCGLDVGKLHVDLVGQITGRVGRPSVHEALNRAGWP